jgi:hypothetical protein
LCVFAIITSEKANKQKQSKRLTGHMAHRTHYRPVQ